MNIKLDQLALYKKHKEIILYLFWGGMTTIVSWGSYSIFTILFSDTNSIVELFGITMSMLVLISNILSWLCAVIFAFISNKLWVFKSKSWKWNVFFSEISKFVSTRAATGLLEIILVPIIVGMGLNQSVFGIEGMLAKIIISILVVLLNYIISKLFIF